MWGKRGKLFRGREIPRNRSQVLLVNVLKMVDGSRRCHRRIDRELFILHQKQPSFSTDTALHLTKTHMCWMQKQIFFSVFCQTWVLVNIYQSNFIVENLWDVQLWQLFPYIQVIIFKGKTIPSISLLLALICDHAEEVMHMLHTGTSGAWLNQLGIEKCDQAKNRHFLC